VPGPGALAVVVVSHNSSAHLPGLLDALGDQLQPDDELVVVDNASSDGSAELATRAGIHTIAQRENEGFGAGCHTGAAATTAPLLLFMNPDSRPEPGCLEALREAADSERDWAAWQPAILQADGTINTDGGVVHYSGIGWAGDCGKPLSEMAPEPYEVAFPSGAALVVRRPIWDEIGGLDPSYFLYSEDLDLGLRVWLAGQRAGIVPGARVVHGYEFDKGQQKWFFLERNRWRTVLAVYPPALLLLLAPALLAIELAIHAAAARGGWLGAKLRADAAVLAGLPVTFRRRRAVQATRRITTKEFATHLTAQLDSPYLPVRDGNPAARAQAAYWAALKRVL
jgi:N-acetylglucosaminyl-diphospho-decaprenol L-rhamnosyltransferase